MQKGIKFRIYPNREQKNFIHQTLGCCRLIYNRGLAMRKKKAMKEGKKIGYTLDFRHADRTEKTGGCFLKAAGSLPYSSLCGISTRHEFLSKKTCFYQPSRANITGSQSYRTVNQKDNIRIVGRYQTSETWFVKIRQSMKWENQSRNR